MQQVQNHPKLTIPFIIKLHDKQVNIVGVTFELSTNAITTATRISSVGEKWFKK